MSSSHHHSTRHYNHAETPREKELRLQAQKKLRKSKARKRRWVRRKLKQ